MNERIEFKKLDLSNLEQVIEIEKDSFADPFSRNMLEEELQNPRAFYIGAVLNYELVGYGGFWQVFDEAHIISVAVLNKYRRQRIGQKLLLRLMHQAIEFGIASMTLEVRKSNIAAQALYAKQGFFNVGERPEYYQDNKENAIIMWNYNIADTINGEQI